MIILISRQTASSFESRHITSILLQPRSLVAFKDDMYNLYLHGIQAQSTDTMTDQVINPDKNVQVNTGDKLERTTRISLTIRHVPKVLKMKLCFAKHR